MSRIVVAVTQSEINSMIKRFAEEIYRTRIGDKDIHVRDGHYFFEVDARLSHLSGDFSTWHCVNTLFPAANETCDLKIAVAGEDQFGTSVKVVRATWDGNKWIGEDGETIQQGSEAYYSKAKQYAIRWRRIPSE